MNGVRAMISEQLLALEASISPSNKLGDVDGLFAHFILEGARIGRWTWEVNCADTTWVQDHASGLTRGNYNLLSALGFSLSITQPNKQDGWFTTFIKGMEVLQKRDLFPTDGVSFPNIPRIFLGLALGAKAIPDANKKDAMCKWLLDVLNQVVLRKAGASPGLTYVCIRSLLVNEPQRVERGNITSVSEMAFLEWGINKHVFEVRDSPKEISEFREHLVSEILSTDAQQLDSTQAAILWYGLNHCLTVSVHELIVSPSHVAIILSRFQDGLRRWRWDSEQVKHPIRWAIREEREIQDIVWMMLRSVFSDLVDEDTLPKFGHSSYKADFGIPSLGLLIEVKMARKAEDFKTIEKEIMEDSRGYLSQTGRYSRILVFIYDDSASVQEHGITKQALKKLPEIEDVIIVSRPSHLPPSTSL